MGDYSCVQSISLKRVGLTHAAVKSPVWPIRARSTFLRLGEKSHMSKVLVRLTTTLLADLKNAHLLLSTGVQKMPVTVSTADGVTVLTVTSDPNSSCPPLCQILKGLCYSPRCCTVSQQLKENQGTSQSTLGVSSLIFRLGYRRLTDFCKTCTGKPISYPCNLKSNIFNIWKQPSASVGPLFPFSSMYGSLSSSLFTYPTQVSSLVFSTVRTFSVFPIPEVDNTANSIFFTLGSSHHCTPWVWENV